MACSLNASFLINFSLPFSSLKIETPSETIIFASKPLQQTVRKAIRPLLQFFSRFISSVSHFTAVNWKCQVNNGSTGSRAVLLIVTSSFSINIPPPLLLYRRRNSNNWMKTPIEIHTDNKGWELTRFSPIVLLSGENFNLYCDAYKKHRLTRRPCQIDEKVEVLPHRSHISWSSGKYSLNTDLI